MMSKTDVQKEYENELNRYRSQQVVIGALMAVKDNLEKIDPDIVQAINITHLSDDLKLNREEVDSLFATTKILKFVSHVSGTKLTSKSLESLQKAKLMKYLAAQINAQCNEVNSFARKMKQEEKFNIFRVDNIMTQIEMLLAEYNVKLVQLVNLKEKLCDLEFQAVEIKTGVEQRKQLEMFRLMVKSKIIENERLKRIMLHRICNQTDGNTEALLKLKEFVDELL